jgi:hypothetical protein
MGETGVRTLDDGVVLFGVVNRFMLFCGVMMISFDGARQRRRSEQ